MISSPHHAMEDHVVRQQQQQQQQPTAQLEPGQQTTKRRGAVACRRCRRLRSKCVHQGAQPPCQSCRAAGPRTATECSFPRRGERDLDREFRRRRREERLLPAGGLPSGQRLEGEGGSALGEAAPGCMEGVLYASSADGTTDGTSAEPAATRLLSEQASRRVDGDDGREQPGSQQSRLSKRGVGRGTRGPGRASKAGVGCSPMLQEQQDATSPDQTRLPPHEEIIQGCKVFTTSYFQLGFTPKTMFIESISRDDWEKSVSRFLIVCILGISARFTPALVRRYGGPSEATKIFMALAARMVPDEMYTPSLERTQAFFLLAIVEWGNGDKDRSSIHMAVAVRMAAILKLHREETYRLPADAAADEVVRSESARRTFWMIQSQENLHSGHNTPTPFAPDEITAYLPCSESDFAFGVVPVQRAALPGTPPALADPGLVFSPGRSLFATLVQAHNLWGHIARRACRPEQEPPGCSGAGGGAGVTPPPPPPWDEDSELSTLTRTLRQWEDSMPARHKWSAWNLRGWKAESLHLAYLSVVMVLRLSNIVVRRIYLEDLLLSVSPSSSTTSTTPPSNPQGIPSGPPPPQQASATAAPPHFWPSVSRALFANVAELHEQIDAYFSSRAPDEGFPAILVFCVYVCGSLASYLWRYPQLCPGGAAAPAVALRSLQVLTELQHAWPAAVRWQQGLRQAQAASAAASLAAALPSSAAGEGEVRVEQVSEAGAGLLPPRGGGGGGGGVGGGGGGVRGPAADAALPACSGVAGARGGRGGSASTAAREGRLHGRGHGAVAVAQSQTQAQAQLLDVAAFPNAWFDAELTAFLQGDVHYGPWAS